MKRIGIFGGTFSPIHIGHLMLAQRARDEYELDRVLIVPNGNPPHKNKNGILDGRHRADMVSLSIADEKGMELYEYELELTEPGYTSDTLAHIREEIPADEYYFIVGADSLDYMDQWHEPQSIFDNAIILVAPRGSLDFEEIQLKIASLQERFQARIELLHVPNVEISSSWIRETVQKGYTIRYYVTPEVEEYIKREGLYQ